MENTIKLISSKTKTMTHPVNGAETGMRGGNGELLK